MTRLVYANAFTGPGLRGNPAAVCLLDRPASTAWMQALAGEVGPSMTAFLWPRGGSHELRWFTPDFEERLCGHATLASAHVLIERGYCDAPRGARFETRAGPVAAVRDDRGVLWIDFPAEPAAPCTAPEGLTQALGVAPTRVAANRLDLFAELPDAQTVAELQPDLAALAGYRRYRGVAVTAPGDGDVDYVCRFFSPQDGIDEDPVTGSIQCALGPWWGARLGRAELSGEQLSKRGGRFRVRPDGGRVHIGGRVALAGEFTLTIPPTPREAT